MSARIHPCADVDVRAHGLAVVLTDDHDPRAVTTGGDAKSATDWTPGGVNVERGASIGARAVCVAPLTIGRWAMVAAGAVVTKDVPDFALVVGVPAKRVGWIGRVGVAPVAVGDGVYKCPEKGEQYVQTGELLEEAGA